MPNDAPTLVNIVSYHIGFGDCFLLQFVYPGFKRHILVDFGSFPRPGWAEETFLHDIAEDIRLRCGGKLDAVVATHRHADHISGFATGKDGSGEIIAACDPEIVVQPWTEDPQAETDATAPTAAFPAGGLPVSPNLAFIRSLEDMHRLSKNIREQAKGFASQERRIVREIAFHGENNIKNYAAVTNLMQMGQKHLGARYVYFGSDSGLGDLLPGVDVQVLGPPTLEQSDAIKKQATIEPNEFWLLKGLVSGQPEVVAAAPARPLTDTGIPPFARWLVRDLDKDLADLREQETLEIVRSLDRVINNTSVILLFSLGTHRLLFSGDAQIENWQYAFAQPGVLDLLKQVTLYKVGHHGSRNATPRTLWDGFARRSTDSEAKYRLVTLLSTQPDVHGSETTNTEVPRRTLLDELRTKSTLVDTQALPVQPAACHVLTLNIVPD